MGAIDKATEAMMHQIIARCVAESVEIARSLGHDVPTEYDVGLKIHSTRHDRRTWNVAISIRLCDAVVVSRVALPELDEPQVSLMDVAIMWENAWRRIRGDAMTVAHVWLDRHPERFTKTPESALTKISDESDQIVKEAVEKSRRLRYARTS